MSIQVFINVGSVVVSDFRSISLHNIKATSFNHADLVTTNENKLMLLHYNSAFAINDDFMIRDYVNSMQYSATIIL